MNSNSKWLLIGILLLWSVSTTGTTAYYYLQYTGVQSAYNALYDEYSDLTGYETILANIGYDYQNGTVQWFNRTSIPFNSTGLYLTNITCHLDGTQYGWGFYVTGINGVASNASGNEYYWSYEVNNEYASVGIDAYHVNFGDVIVWKYVSWV